MPSRLYPRLVLSLALGLALTTVPFGLWLGHTQARRYVDTVRETAVAVAGTLAKDSARFLVIGEYAGLENQLLEAAHVPGVRSIHLFEPDAMLVAHVHKSSDDTEPAVFYVQEPWEVPSTATPYWEERPDELVTWTPIEAGQLLGWLETTHDLAPVNSMRRSIWRQTFLLGAAWAAFAVAIVTLLLRPPMAAIGALSRFARELPRRKGERLGLRRMENEIGDLAASLDQASVELAESERQQQALEAQLLHAQRLEAVGQLASGIAHDFNNILTGIIGYGSLLLEMTPRDDARRLATEEVVQGARRAATLTRGLLAFSRKERAELSAVDLNEVIRGVERMLLRIIGEDVELTSALAPERLVVNADAAQLEQVLINLVTNARDAMPAGGRVTLETARGAPEATADAEPSPRGPCACVRVTDTGQGMDEETARRIFEPFFTTKKEGHGTGLGLSIVHGIVLKHGGAIRVASRPGEGTTFRIYLPLAEGAAAPAASAEAAPAPGGHERILIVEDDLEVRRVARSILERGGYRVVEAANGVEALALLGAEEPFALVVTDVVMPRMGGRELRDALRTRSPGLPVLFISGYSQEVIRQRALLEEGAEVLAKPFTARGLLARVRALLDG